MKKIIHLIILFLCSCNTPSSKPRSGIRKEVKTILLGADKDEHGCKTSAGYQWSDIKKDCIRPFELSLQLSSLNETNSAGVIFSTDSLMVEIFSNEGILNLKKIDANRGYSNKNWLFHKTNNAWLLRNSSSQQIVYLQKK